MNPVALLLKMSLIWAGMAQASALALAPAQSRADDQTAAGETRKAPETLPLRVVAPRLTPTTERIFAALNHPVDWQFTGQTLADVMNFLAGNHNITIRIDADALKAAGLKPDADIHLVVSGVTLRTGLEHMLAKVQGVPLDYIIDQDVMTITTRKEAANFLESRIYDLRGIATATPDEVVEILKTTIAPESWQEQGGKGTAIVLQGGVLVNQSQRNHSLVTSRLNLLNQHSQLDLSPTGPFKYATSFPAPAIDPRKFALTGRPRPATDHDLLSVDSRTVSTLEQQIREAMRQEVSLSFNRRGLQDVMNSLGEQYRFKTRIDAVTLSEANVPPNAEVRFVASRVTLENALALMFLNIGGKTLDWMIEDGALVVTTADHAKGMREPRKYDVRGITSDPQMLLPLLNRWCEPEDAIVEAGSLVITASQPVHREILPFLEQLTEFRQVRAAAEERARETRPRAPTPTRPAAGM